MGLDGRARLQPSPGVATFGFSPNRSAIQRCSLWNEAGLKCRMAQLLYSAVMPYSFAKILKFFSSSNRGRRNFIPNVRSWVRSRYSASSSSRTFGGVECRK